MSMPSSIYVSPRQRMAAYSNSPWTRRNRVERNQCKKLATSPLVSSDRKRLVGAVRTKKRNPNREDAELNLSELPVLALSRIFFYLPMKDRLALSQTCRKLHQSEAYSRRHRCALNIRNDLIFFYKEHLQSGGLIWPKDVFGSLDLFHNVLRRALNGEPGSICCLEKIATIDFSPPQCVDGSDGDRKRWGGRTFLTEWSLRSCFDRFSALSVVELRLHHCYVNADTLRAFAEAFVGLEKLSVSLKGVEFPSTDPEVATLDEQLADAVCNWSSLVSTKKKNILSSNVKEMIIYVYAKFPFLEMFLLYNV